MAPFCRCGIGGNAGLRSALAVLIHRQPRNVLAIGPAAQVRSCRRFLSICSNVLAIGPAAQVRDQVLHKGEHGAGDAKTRRSGRLKGP